MIAIDLATPADIDAINAIADREKHALGFVHRGALVRAIAADDVLAARDGPTLVGFCHVYRRRDGVVTIYHLVVVPERRRLGVGRAIIAALARHAAKDGMAKIRLKCPTDLVANDFYAQIGFKHVAAEAGVIRTLNVWEWSGEPESNLAQPPE